MEKNTKLQIQDLGTKVNIYVRALNFISLAANPLLTVLHLYNTYQSHLTEDIPLCSQSL
jgi:hypothetical protein